jgi:hypothetical protein
VRQPPSLRIYSEQGQAQEGFHGWVPRRFPDHGSLVIEQQAREGFVKEIVSLSTQSLLRLSGTWISFERLASAAVLLLKQSGAPFVGSHRHW